MHDDDERGDGPGGLVGGRERGELVGPGPDEPDMSALAEELVASATERGIALTGADGLLTALTRQVLQSALEAELSAHLGYDKHDPLGRNRGNSRNGSTAKTVRTEIGEVTVSVPRDRHGTFEPVIVPKHQRRLPGFDENVISLYAKGLTTGDIVAHLEDVYDTTVSRDLVSRVTDRVLKDLRDWQARPLDAVYPVILIDAIVLKVRSGTVANRPVYVAIGITVDGYRDVLGMWVGPTGGEGAKQWMNMLTDLRNRGILDACIVCCDGLKGLPEAIVATWPQAVVQLCVVHLVRNSLRYASKADWQAITRGLEDDLHGTDRGGGRGRVPWLRRDLGAQVPGHDRDVETLVGGVHPVPGVPARDRADLHHQRDRVAQRQVPCRHPAPGPLPRRGLSPQGALPRHPRTAPEPGQPHWCHRRLEEHPQRPDHDLRRPPGHQPEPMHTYTKFQTVPIGGGAVGGSLSCCGEPIEWFASPEARGRRIPRVPHEGQPTGRSHRGKNVDPGGTPNPRTRNGARWRQSGDFHYRGRASKGRWGRSTNLEYKQRGHHQHFNFHMTARRQNGW